MFGKTREKLEDRYVKPVENAITLAVVFSLLAFLMAAAALLRGR